MCRLGLSSWLAMLLPKSVKRVQLLLKNGFAGVVVDRVLKEIEGRMTLLIQLEQGYKHEWTAILFLGNNLWPDHANNYGCCASRNKESRDLCTAILIY